MPSNNAAVGSPKRKPTPLKILDGTIKSGDGKFEPKVSVAAPEPPSYLMPHEREMWDKFVKVLMPMRIMAKEDFAAFEAMVCSFAEYVFLRKSIREKLKKAASPEEGYTYETFNKYGAVKRMIPEFGAVGDAERRIVAFLGRFGLSPTDRGRVIQDEGEFDNPQNEFAQSVED